MFFELYYGLVFYLCFIYGVCFGLVFLFEGLCVGLVFCLLFKRCIESWCSVCSFRGVDWCSACSLCKGCVVVWCSLCVCLLSEFVAGVFVSLLIGL